jgi:hypothetical protein
MAVGLAFIPAAGMTQSGSTKEENERIAALVRQLGDNKFAKREVAHKELETLGEAALEALRQAALASNDVEVRQRAGQLITALAQINVKSVPPPQGAVVLFDGKNLDAWVHRDGKTNANWGLMEGGAMEARWNDIRTRQTFADPYKLHVEFRIPPNPPNTIHGRGNSGVYLHGRYEVQILDSFGPQANNPQAVHSAPAESCGAIFGQTAPRLNACKAPGFWQNYDIEFHPPRFKGGLKVEHARLTALHNGALIHDRVQILVDDTGLGLPDDPDQPGPVMLQFHSSPVQFRNIWLLRLPMA